jgi:hypothetical protein
LEKEEDFPPEALLNGAAFAAEWGEEPAPDRLGDFLEDDWAIPLRKKKVPEFPPLVSPWTGRTRHVLEPAKKTPGAYPSSP